MIRLILTLSFLLYAIPSKAIDCKGPTVNISIYRLSVAEPTIYSDGTLRVAFGEKEGELVDVFYKGRQAFSGLSVHRETQEDKDTRNAFLRWAFPREPEPPKYYLNISLNDFGRSELQGRDLTRINVSFRQEGRLIQGAFFVNPDISYNCKPK